MDNENQVSVETVSKFHCLGLAKNNFILQIDNEISCFTALDSCLQQSLISYDVVFQS